MRISKIVREEMESLQLRGHYHMRVAAEKQKGNNSMYRIHRDKPASYYEGMAMGAYTALSSLLMAHKAYTGYIEKEIEGSDLKTQHYID